MIILKRVINPTSLTGALLLTFGAIDAQAQTVRQLYKVDMTILPDRSSTFTMRVETTPLTAGAVQSISSYRLSFTGNQTLDITEAYTRKADGRIVPVDVAQIATQDGAVGPLISYTDVKYKQIPFRDLDAGDTWVLVYKGTEKDQHVPGLLSRRFIAYNGSYERIFDISVEAPKEMPLHHSERDFAHTESATESGVKHRWSGTFFRPASGEQDIANMTDRLPHVSFSTIASYEGLGDAAFKVTETRSTVSPEVRKLAADIVGTQTDPRKQAEAIYRWVSKNVQYVAVFNGLGRWAPNEPGVILNRRYGDCKDHAALLKALLGAVGIEAETVLINSGAERILTPTPTNAAFNHEITYIPAFDLYADATSPFVPFGSLPGGDADQPVVRMSSKGSVVARTPVGGTEQNAAIIETKVKIDDAGIISGETVTVATGEEAQSLRRFANRTEIEGQDTVLRELAKTKGVVGKTSIEVPASRDHKEPYAVTVRWTEENPLQLPEKRWRPTYGMSPIGLSASQFFGRFDRALRSFPILCRPGNIVHNVTVTLPEGMTPGSLPKSIAQKTSLYTFTRDWSADGNQLTIKSKLTASPASRTCNPDVIKEIAELAERDKELLNPLIKFARKTS